jgi:hypothetical protein
MTFQYVGVDEAIKRSGVRMVVVQHRSGCLTAFRRALERSGA